MRIALAQSIITAARLQNLLKLLLLVGRQGGGELDVVLDDEVAPLTSLLGDGHAEVGVDILRTGLRGARLLETDPLVVDSSDGALKHISCLPPPAWSPTPLERILLPLFGSGLMGMSSTLPVVVTLPLPASATGTGAPVDNEMQPSLS